MLEPQVQVHPLLFVDAGITGASAPIALRIHKFLGEMRMQAMDATGAHADY